MLKTFWKFREAMEFRRGWVAGAGPALLGAFLLGCRPGGETGPGAGRPDVQVVAVAAKIKSVTETISPVGNVLANEMVEIKSETDGMVEKILFEEGQEVEAGALLIQLDETKFATALEQAQAELALSRSNFQRSQSLFADKLVSRQEYDQAESRFQAAQALVELRKRNLKDSRIYAPFEGVVGARQVSPGQVISRNTTLTWLVDLDPVKVEINVPERFLSELAVGQPVEIKVAAYPEEVFTGRVYFIAPFVDPATRTALLKATVPNPEKRLKPGMFASLELTLNIRDQSVVIPEAAVVQLLDESRAMVYVVDEEQKARMVRVRLGVRMPGEVEVLEGISAGRRVIVEGTQKIGPETPVTLAPAKDEAPYSEAGEEMEIPEAGGE